jgi:hypothetical protein
MSTRTITLSDRRPVTIDEKAWPVIASAMDEEHDGQVRSQANRESEWAIRVRLHDDGRMIIYATYSYSSNWQGERHYSVRHGMLVEAEAVIAEAIKAVATRMAAAEHAGDDAARWAQLADDCIADLPAETL